MNKDDLAFSAPLTVSREDFARIRTELLAAIEKASNIVGPSNPEVVAVLNLDWLCLYD